ncbi:hypothetical protein BT69DRAFT_96138 [Atractiella rhizophila]|nr:hypothetical protein BT69DRAFT_96138 [Atractiella rhizophila]
MNAHLELREGRKSTKQPGEDVAYSVGGELPRQGQSVSYIRVGNILLHCHQTAPYQHVQSTQKTFAETIRQESEKRKRQDSFVGTN